MLELKTEIAIDAGPERVYEILSDFARYSEWNPFITRASGEAVAGRRFEMHMEPPGGKSMDFEPTLLRTEPGVELRWIGRMLLPGLFSGEHYFTLEARPGGTHLIHGEYFRGLLIPLFRNGLETGVREGFELMNAAVKERAEGS
ncbi:MAG: SRPBCC domain-containing protein [bacterium]|nr:SRPBCC domain-containing protein [bacterium]